MKEDNELFFVGIDNNAELRRNILESVKFSIENLQSYEKLKGIGDEKIKNTARLRSLLREISSLVNDMKDELPKTGLKAKPKPKEVRLVKQVEKKVVVKAETASELDKLDKELRDIESKLNSIV